MKPLEDECPVFCADIALIKISAPAPRATRGMGRNADAPKIGTHEQF